MPQRPNLLVIMSDQHSPDIIGAAGDPHVHTPNLDRLARQGTMFTRAYCNNPICVPSRMSFLSGMTTQQIECWSLSDTIRSDLATWPTVLGAGGYETVMSGRMHCWWPDKHFGFQKRLCGDVHTRLSTGTWEPYWEGPEREKQLQFFRDKWLFELFEGNTGIGPHNGAADDPEATDCAVEYIRQREDSEPPFALCVGYLCPHSPLRVAAKYFERYKDMPVELDSLDGDLPPMLRTFAHRMGCDKPLDAQTLQCGVRAYYGMVTFIDELVGRLLTALEASGQLENTIVIYTSDHGEMLGRRGLWFKNQLLEPSIRTPLLVMGPGVRAGQRPSEVVSLLDLYPTLCDYASVEPWPEIAGQSLRPLLEQGNAMGFEDRPVFIEYADYGIGQPAACIRRGHLKLIHARTYDPLLYDLERDPAETTNRYSDPNYAEAVARLESDLAQHWNAEETWLNVIRNQRRVHLHRLSKQAAAAREGREV